MTTIEALEDRINALEQSMIQFQKNFTPVVTKVDNTSIDVKNITPYTDTKIGYYGDKYKTFYNVPEGNISVFFTNYNGNYVIERSSETVKITFLDDEKEVKALEKQTNITIMVQ